MTSRLQDVDVISRFNGLGAVSQSAHSAFYGVNHRGVGNALPTNTDNHGLTFFTRPRLNLSYDNLAMHRVLTPLLTNDDSSYQRAVRVLLDPEGQMDAAINRSGDNKPAVEMRQTLSRLVDGRNAFMPLLSNNLISLSGWPDPVAAYYDSTPGPQREVWSMIDDTLNQYGTYDLTATFRNVAGDPITLLLYTWILYATLVYQGVLMPYPDSVLENEIDYNTRIYRLVLDPTRQYVQKIAACGAAFPISPAMGSAFDFNSESPFTNDRASQISIPFHCVGAIYQDPILIREFNDTVYLFNRDMASGNLTKRMVKIPYSELALFNYLGYPRISPRTMELQWWVYKEDYAAIKELRKTLRVQPTA